MLNNACMHKCMHVLLCIRWGCETSNALQFFALYGAYSSEFMPA
jgi:hypothetical protein